jgi:hypothetical protein
MVDGRPARPAAERTVLIDNDRVRAGDRRFVLNPAAGWRRLMFAFVEIDLKDRGSG